MTRRTRRSLSRGLGRIFHSRGLALTGVVTKSCVQHSGDAQVGPGRQADKPGPVQVLADSAYGSGAARKEFSDAGHESVIKPKPLQAAVPGGFTLDDFIIDQAAGPATCPNGLTRPITASRGVTYGAGCTL